MIIRAATLQDIPAIIAIEQTAQIKPWQQSDFISAFEQKDLIWVIEQENIVHGWIGVRVCLDEAEILNFAIDHKSQHKGLGRALLAQVLQNLSALAVKTLFLEVRQSNQAAIKLYQKAGFLLYSERKSYYSTITGREDALLFRYDFC